MVTAYILASALFHAILTRAAGNTLSAILVWGLLAWGLIILLLQVV
jgi:hypothetical protein